MSANDGAASSSNVAAEGNFEPSANDEAASSSDGNIITNSDQDANNEAASAEVQLDVLDEPYQQGDPKDGNRRCESDEEYKKEIEKMKESHLIVAGLIATVTFTAAFTLPGGVIQDVGTAILSKKAAFQAFVITDAIAMVLSLSAVFAHFLISMPIIRNQRGRSEFVFVYGGSSTVMAMGAMVIAFVTGTYAVLTTSLWLSILTTFIGFSFFLLMFLISKGMMFFDQVLD